MADLSEANVQEIIRLLRELVRWSKFEVIPKLRTVLEQNLPSDKEKKIYELSDGERSTRDIAKLSGVSHQTIANYWEKWSKLGIVDTTETKEGRYRRICSLEQVGLEVPEVKVTEIEQGQEKQEDDTSVRGE
jgi:hypothetical protein